MKAKMGAVQKEKVTQLETTYKSTIQKQEKTLVRKRQGLIRRLVVFAVFASVIAYSMGSTLISQNAKISEKLKEKEELELQMVQLKEDQKVLEEEIVKLNDDEYVAKIARRDYFLSNEDEIIFKINSDSSSY
jgi:cell division protein DivIC